jgi:hypothetical protein
MDLTSRVRISREARRAHAWRGGGGGGGERPEAIWERGLDWIGLDLTGLDLPCLDYDGEWGGMGRNVR